MVLWENRYRNIHWHYEVICVNRSQYNGLECCTQRLDVEDALQFVWSVVSSFGVRTRGGRRGCTKGNGGGRVIAVVVKVVVVVEEEKEEGDDFILGQSTFKQPKRPLSYRDSVVRTNSGWLLMGFPLCQYSISQLLCSTIYILHFKNALKYLIHWCLFFVFESILFFLFLLLIWWSLWR